MKPLRIFISSVQKEFAEERMALRDYLLGDALLRRFFECFLFEEVPAADRRADEVYLDEVERCDIYLGLFGNDYGYEHIFERQVVALGQDGDVLLGISTSGASANVLRALAAAREKNLISVGFTGAQGGAISEFCDLLLRAPSNKTAIIQQIHITAAHVVCALVERTMFPRC